MSALVEFLLSLKSPMIDWLIPLAVGLLIGSIPTYLAYRKWRRNGMTRKASLTASLTGGPGPIDP